MKKTYLNKIGKTLIVLLVGLIIIIGILVRLLIFYHGYLFFGNFFPPLNISQLNLFPFWNPYAFNGFPNSTPFITILYTIAIVPFLTVPVTFLGIEIGAKFFIVITTFMLFASYFYLSRHLVTGLTPVVISSIFFIANPISLMILINGDFQQFFFEALLLFGLTFMLKSLNHKDVLNFYLLIAAVFFSVSIAFIQGFYLGFLLYVLIPPISLAGKKFSSKINALKRISFNLIFLVLITVIILIPFIFSTFLASYDLSPNSITALPLSTFAAYSSSPISILLLKAYSPNFAWSIVENFYGTIIYTIWNLMEIVLIYLILALGFLLKDKRLIYLSLLDVLFALLGAGTKSPISIFNIYLYLHMYGYQAINTSYFWDWIPISVSYSISLSIILQNLFCRKNNQTIQKTKKDRLRYFPFSQLRLPRKLIGIFLVFTVLFVIVLPISTQGYFNAKGGINEHYLPLSYSNIPVKLKELIGNNDTGVIYFTPDSAIFYNNATQDPTINPLIVFPTERTLQVPGYLTPQVQSTNYLFWLMKLFYENRTQYLAQLASLQAIQYFVVLFNVSSASFYPYYMPWSYGINASNLMVYQKGIKLIFQNSAYAIYKNMCDVTPASVANNFTIVLGNYDTLNEMAYDGMDLSKLAIVFGSDLNYTNYNFYLKNTTQIVSKDSNLTGLIIRSLNPMSILNPLNYISNSNSSPNNAWINSYRYFINSPEFVLNSINPAAITFGKSKLLIPIDSTGTGSYCMVFRMLFSGTLGGKLDILVNNNSRTFLTNSRYMGDTAYSWIKLQVNLSRGMNLINFNSLSGWNSIGRIYLFSPSQLHENMRNLSKSIHNSSINITFLLGGNELTPSNKLSQYDYPSVNSNLIPNGKYIFISDVNTSLPKATLLFQFNGFGGYLTFNLLATAYSNFKLSYGNYTLYFGISPGVYGNTMPWGEFSIPLTYYTPNEIINLTLESEGAAISEVSYTTATPKFSHIQFGEYTIGNVTQIYQLSGITNLSYKVTGNTIVGQFDYKNITQNEYCLR